MKIMNREYLLIGIALGRTSAETNNITLQKRTRKPLSGTKRSLRRLRKRAGILFFMLLIWIKLF